MRVLFVGLQSIAKKLKACWLRPVLFLAAKISLLYSIALLGVVNPSAAAAAATPSTAVTSSTTATLRAQSGHDFQLSVVSPSQASSLYSLVAANSEIPYRYLGDGCYANAHKITQILEEQGVIAGKVHAEGSLKYQTPTGAVRTWEFHVATLIAVQTEQGPKEYVIDPAFVSGPISLEQWLAKMESFPEGKVQKFLFTKRFNYLPTDATSDMNGYDEADTENMNRTHEEYRNEVRAGRIHR